MRVQSGAIVAVMALVVWGGGALATGRYAFYRQLGVAWSGPEREGDGARRVFGGRSAELGAYPAVCALLDRYWSARCSGAVVSRRWVLTAAHCVTANIAYVKYNSRLPTGGDGDVAPVHYLYRHPEYKVVQADEGRGMDVTLLHHDVGLVRTRHDMVLATSPPLDPLHAMRLHRLHDINNAEVQVLGYGRTEQARLGEELFVVRLQVVSCERGAWVRCVCGVARAGEAARGVCSGDSGGPVLLGDTSAQVAVTSMGPLECAGGAGGAGDGGSVATSVFTELEPYADLINATIHDMEAMMRMRRLSRAPPPHARHAHTAAALLALMLAAR